MGKAEDKMKKWVEVDDIDDAPTVDAEPVKHGVWFGTVCSCCGASTSFSYDCEYCPNCGALMDGEVEGRKK